MNDGKDLEKRLSQMKPKPVGMYLRKKCLESALPPSQPRFILALRGWAMVSIAASLVLSLSLLNHYEAKAWQMPAEKKEILVVENTGEKENPGLRKIFSFLADSRVQKNNQALWHQRLIYTN